MSPSTCVSAVAFDVWGGQAEIAVDWDLASTLLLHLNCKISAQDFQYKLHGRLDFRCLVRTNRASLAALHPECPTSSITSRLRYRLVCICTFHKDPAVLCRTAARVPLLSRRRYIVHRYRALNAPESRHTVRNTDSVGRAAAETSISYLIVHDNLTSSRKLYGESCRSAPLPASLRLENTIGRARVCYPREASSLSSRGLPCLSAKGTASILVLVPVRPIIFPRTTRRSRLVGLNFGAPTGTSKVLARKQPLFIFLARSNAGATCTVSCTSRAMPVKRAPFVFTLYRGWFLQRLVARFRAGTYRLKCIPILASRYTEYCTRSPPLTCKFLRSVRRPVKTRFATAFKDTLVSFLATILRSLFRWEHFTCY